MLEGAFASSFEDTTKGLSGSSPKGLLLDLYKDAQEEAFEVTIEGAFEVAMELHLNMYMVVHLLERKRTRKDLIKK